MAESLYYRFDYLIGRGKDFSVDFDKLFLFGFSSGAGFICGLLNHAKQKNIFFRKSFFACPFLDFSGVSEEFESVQMWKANEEEDKFSGKIKSATVRAFGLEKEADLSDPRWIPFRYSEEFLSQLGKIGFIVPKADAFYRATMAFYQKLRRA